MKKTQSNVIFALIISAIGLSGLSTTRAFACDDHKDGGKKGAEVKKEKSKDKKSTALVDDIADNVNEAAGTVASGIADVANRAKTNLNPEKPKAEAAKDDSEDGK